MKGIDISVYISYTVPYYFGISVYISNTLLLWHINVHILYLNTLTYQYTYCIPYYFVGHLTEEYSQVSSSSLKAMAADAPLFLWKLTAE